MKNKYKVGDIVTLRKDNNPQNEEGIDIRNVIAVEILGFTNRSFKCKLISGKWKVNGSIRDYSDFNSSKFMFIKDLIKDYYNKKTDVEGLFKLTW